MGGAQHPSWGAGDRQRASRQHSWGGRAVLTRPQCKTSWRHFSNNTEALPKEGGPAGLSVSQGPAVGGVESGGLWWRPGEHSSSPRPRQKAHCCLGGAGAAGRVHLLRPGGLAAGHHQVRGRGASVLLNKGLHAGGRLQCLHPRPASVGSCPHAPASAWLRGSPPLPLGTLGKPRTRIRQTSESGGGGGGAWNSSPRQCTPPFLQETRGLLVRVEALAGQGALPTGRGCGWQVAFSVAADAAIGTAPLFLCSISAPVFASLEGGPVARAVRHPEDAAWPRVPGSAEEGGAGSVGVSCVFHSSS